MFSLVLSASAPLFRCIEFTSHALFSYENALALSLLLSLPKHSEFIYNCNNHMDHLWLYTV